MRFNSLEFALFFPLIFVLSLALEGRRRQLLLLFASWFFYGTWNAPFLLLLWFTTGFDYLMGARIARTERPAARKACLALSLAANLGILIYFKYGNFFLDNIAFVSGIDPSPFYLKLVIPLGISFYTFQSMSYVIDVYRREIAPCDDFLQYSLYVTFFPHLIAGPILRAREFLPQLKRVDPIRQEEILRGVELFLLGLFKKVVVADNVAVMVDRVFEAPERFGAPAIGLGAALFLVQVYCDFSGYSTMAQGLGSFFGIKLPRNFDYPLLRWNPLLYRRSWHVTMGNWFQDYVFRPLGGSRAGDARYAFNLIATWTLLGLWHGASWHFVLWGFMNGIILATYLVTLRRKTWSLPDLPGRRIGGWMINAFFWLPGSIFFRAQNLHDVRTMLARLYTGAPGLGIAWGWYAALAALVGVHLLSFLYYKEDLLERAAWPGRVALVSTMTLLIAALGAEGRTFIYFQF